MRAGLALVAVAALATGCGSGTPQGATTHEAKVSPNSKVTAKPVLPQRQACPEWHPPKDDSDYGEHSGPPPEIPRDFGDVVTASRTMITVQGLAGKPACVPLSWIDSVDQFSLSPDKRFLDFATEGFESYGHILVDRRTGDWVDTGDLPAFSNDGTMVASVQIRLDWMGSLEGAGVWRVTPKGFVEVTKIKDIPQPGDPMKLADILWSVDRWVGNQCAEVSAVEQQAYDAAVARGEEPLTSSKVHWYHYRLAPVKGKWRLEATKDRTPCFRPAGLTF